MPAVHTDPARKGVADLSVHIVWFEAAVLRGVPALGVQEALAWSDVVSIIANDRRIGEKDGPGFVPMRCVPEMNGRHVRRLGRNMLARTMVALDCETNKKTGEVPPAPADVVARLQRLNVSAVVYTTHSHTPGTNPRYRVVMPLSEEIAPALPAPEIMAHELAISGVFDRSKRNPASLFYLPSAACLEVLDQHEAHVIGGKTYDAAMMREKAGALQAERQAEHERIAAEAHSEAQRRLQARVAAGFDPDNSLIEKLRARLDLKSVLLAHGYDLQGTKFRHPNSSSGSFGADVKVLGGIERIYSHNATDPLHHDNLPNWCGSVTALDVIDVVSILDFGGDRTRALRELAQRFGLSKVGERKVLAKLIFRLVRQQAPQAVIEASAFAEGLRVGMTRAEVIQVAHWVVNQLTNCKAA